MNSRAEPAPWLIYTLQVALVTAALGAWEFSARSNRLISFFFSRPMAIASRVWEWVWGETIYRHVWQTLAETTTGFLLGVLAGLVIALICYYSPLIYRITQPFIDVANAMPRAVFGPLFILWFGLGMTSKSVLAASLVVFIVFYATLTGLREVDQNVVYKIRLLGSSQRDLLVHVLLPSALVWVFSSLRTSVGFALAGAVVGEYIGSTRGIGYQIALSEGNLDATGIFAGLFVLSVMVLGMNAVLQWIERRLAPWRAA